MTSTGLFSMSIPLDANLGLPRVVSGLESS